MNQVLKHLAASMIESDWESEFSGTVLNFCLGFKDKTGNVVAVKFVKVKQWTFNPNAHLSDRGRYSFRNTTVGKILEAHQLIRGFFLGVTTAAKLRKELSHKTILNAIRLQYRAVVRDAGHEQHPRFTVEWDDSKEPGDRLAIHYTSQEVLNDKI